MLPFASANDRRHQLDSGSVGQSHDLIDDLVDALLPDLFAAVRAVWNADPRPQKTHVVIDFRDSSYR